MSGLQALAELSEAEASSLRAESAEVSLQVLRTRKEAEDRKNDLQKNKDMTMANVDRIHVSQFFLSVMADALRFTPHRIS